MRRHRWPAAGGAPAACESAVQSSHDVEDRAALAGIALGALDRVPFGVVLVDADGSVVFANREARRIAREAGGAAGTWGSEARACAAIEATALQHLVRQARLQHAPTGAGMVLPCAGSRMPPLHVLVTGTGETSPPGTAIFITDPARRRRSSLHVLRGCFGFTAAEARVVQELLDGRSISDAAGALSLTISTVRSYVKSILAKTGCRSQTALTGLLLRSVAAIEPDSR